MGSWLLPNLPCKRKTSLLVTRASLLVTRALLLGARTLLGAPGLTRNKKLLGLSKSFDRSDAPGDIALWPCCDMSGTESCRRPEA